MARRLYRDVGGTIAAHAQYTSHDFARHQTRGRTTECDGWLVQAARPHGSRWSFDCEEYLLTWKKITKGISRRKQQAQAAEKRPRRLP